MRTVTQNIKVELENNERVALNQALAVLRNFLGTMADNRCSSAYFEDCGVEHTVSEIQIALRLIDVLADENPIIK